MPAAICPQCFEPKLVPIMKDDAGRSETCELDSNGFPRELGGSGSWTDFRCLSHTVRNAQGPTRKASTDLLLPRAVD